jgi:four helix bundle protein
MAETKNGRNEMSGWIDRAEDLEVFRRAYALSLEVHRASLEFPRIEQFALADQIRRASKSICANLAEGFSRQRLSRPEFRRFVVMALGSADEMQVWMLYCRDLGYVDPISPSGGRANTGRSRECSPACIAAVVISDF